MTVIVSQHVTKTTDKVDFKTGITERTTTYPDGSKKVQRFSGSGNLIEDMENQDKPNEIEDKKVDPMSVPPELIDKAIKWNKETNQWEEIK